MDLGAVADFIADAGQPATLRRLGPRGIHFDVELPVVIRLLKGRNQANALGPSAVELDPIATISNREIEQAQWPGPPRKGDQLIVNGQISTLIEAPDTTQVGDVVVKHVMRIRG